MTTKEAIINHIQGHNKFQTEERLLGLDNESLLANTHPIYRQSYKKQFEDEKPKRHER